MDKKKLPKNKKASHKPKDARSTDETTQTETKTYGDTSQEIEDDTEVEDEAPMEDDEVGVARPEFKPIRTPTQVEPEEGHAKFEDLNKDVLDPLPEDKQARYLILMRNAEQMNKIFPDWLKKSYVNGKWTPTDMNQPAQLPSRKDPRDWASDPPLTEMGLSITSLIGKAYLDAGIPISHIYTSPALRCVQTAHQIIKAQNAPIKIKVEPGFFDFFGNKNKPVPHFMSVQELLDNDLSVDAEYKQMVDVAELSTFSNESPPEYFKRQANNIYNVIKSNSTGTILIIAHPFTIHASGRGLLGRQILSITQNDLARIPFNYPYLVGMAFRPCSDGCWQIAPRVVPMLNFSHFSNRFNHFFFNKA